MKDIPGDGGGGGGRGELVGFAQSLVEFVAPLVVGGVFVGGFLGNGGWLFAANI